MSSQDNWVSNKEREEDNRFEIQVWRIGNHLY